MSECVMNKSSLSSFGAIDRVIGSFVSPAVGPAELGVVQERTPRLVMSGW